MKIENKTIKTSKYIQTYSHKPLKYKIVIKQSDFTETADNDLKITYTHTFTYEHTHTHSKTSGKRSLQEGGLSSEQWKMIEQHHQTYTMHSIPPPKKTSAMKSKWKLIKLQKHYFNNASLLNWELDLECIM